MFAKLLVIGVFASILGTLLYVVKNNGKKAEQLRAMREAAKREAKERKRANEDIDKVRNMSNDDVRTRLRKISEGHQRNGL